MIVMERMQERHMDVEYDKRWIGGRMYQGSWHSSSSESPASPLREDQRTLCLA